MRENKVFKNDKLTIKSISLSKLCIMIQEEKKLIKI